MPYYRGVYTYMYNSSNLSSKFSTKGKTRAAVLVADATGVKMIILWGKVIDRVMPNAELAFPKLNGSRTKHLERIILWQRRSWDTACPLPLFKKELEIRNKRENPMQQALSQTISHSSSTAETYNHVLSNTNFVGYMWGHQADNWGCMGHQLHLFRI